MSELTDDQSKALDQFYAEEEHHARKVREREEFERQIRDRAEAMMIQNHLEFSYEAEEDKNYVGE